MKRTTVVIALSLLLILTSDVISAATPSSQDDGQPYTVQSGDWLVKLAEGFYGDPMAWPTIWEATNLKSQQDSTYTFIPNPDLITIGQKLWIPSTPVLDSFSPKGLPSINCSSFGDERAVAALGYCTYCVNCDTELSHVDLTNGEQALRVTYSLPPHPTPGWDNWLSIRREPGIWRNLSKYPGLKLRLRVEKPTNALFRISLPYKMNG
jgi:hypothetical protein